MHIAILLGSLARGGAERVVVNLIDFFISKGDQVTLVTQFEVSEEYPLNPKAKRYISGLTDEEMTQGRLKNFKLRHEKLRNIWLEVKPDLIFSVIGKNNFMAISTSRGLNIPVVTSVCAVPELEYYNKSMEFLAKTYLVKSDVLIVQTSQQRSYFPSWIQKKSILMKNPINPVFTSIEIEGKRDNTIVSVGRIDENKNNRMLIDAFSDIASDVPEWNVYIYGDGELRDELIAYVDSIGMSDRIFLPGRIENVPDTIKNAGIFVLSSDTEGSPNALIEALCLGLPVISTDCPCGGPADLIEDGVNGLLIPVGDTAKMQDSLQKLISDFQLREKMSEQAIRTRDIYNPERVCSEWRELFKKLVNKGKTN